MHRPRAKAKANAKMALRALTLLALRAATVLGQTGGRRRVAPGTAGGPGTAAVPGGSGADTGPTETEAGALITANAPGTLALLMRGSADPPNQGPHKPPGPHCGPLMTLLEQGLHLP